jgi:hypothetical protein
MHIVWKAELPREMMSHLSTEQQNMLMNKLSQAVDTIAAEFKVGREFQQKRETQ